MSEPGNGTTSNLNLKSFRKTVITRFALLYIVLGSIFFLPAWSFAYWQAWIYMLTLLVPMIFLIRYLYKHDRELLKRRMRMKERLGTQKLVIVLSWPVTLTAFIIPGFDHRWYWSSVPWGVTIMADLLVLSGYLLVALVFKENSYASRIIEVEKGQKVITSGPYAMVRHPMYLGVLVLYVFSPLALGSFWAMIPAALLVPLLVARIMSEEKELIKGLEGYKEYVIKTKYRLVPGIW